MKVPHLRETSLLFLSAEVKMIQPGTEKIWREKGGWSIKKAQTRALAQHARLEWAAGEVPGWAGTSVRMLGTGEVQIVLKEWALKMRGWDCQRPITALRFCKGSPDLFCCQQRLCLRRSWAQWKGTHQMQGRLVACESPDCLTYSLS